MGVAKNQPKEVINFDYEVERGCMNFGRTELDNFDVDNAWDIIDLFEQKMKNFCGSPHGICR